MANDRIWLVHKASGEKTLLYKYYCCPGGADGYGDRIVEFVNECMDDVEGQDLGGDPHFEVVAESGVNWAEAGAYWLGMLGFALAAPAATERVRRIVGEWLQDDPDGWMLVGNIQSPSGYWRDAPGEKG